MNYIIEKKEDAIAQENVYIIKHFKTAIDMDGNPVSILDEDNIERVTISELQDQKISHQDAIAKIDELLAQIEEL